MKKLIYTINLLVALFLISCNDENYLLYDGETRLQFGPTPANVYSSASQLRDTLKSYTFVYENASVVQDTVFFDIYTMGIVSDKDRVFKLKQVTVAGVDNCVAGVHYKAFDDPTVAKHYVIKAGSNHMRVPIVFLREASLKSMIYTLRVEIEENENFKLGETTKLWRKVHVADMLVKPNAWTTYMENFFGKYSYVKHSWMVQQTGYRWDQDFIAAISASGYAEMSYWKTKLKTLLFLYNSNPSNPGVPLTDEFGQLVSF